jgi:predicted DNA-binding transcriptional regulator YafY
MSRIDRLFQLLNCLRSRPPPATAAQLAADLGVSARTIHRDIDTLRGLGAIIDGAAGFGFTLIEDASLPPLGFTDEEIEALVLGLREVVQIGDPDLAEAAQSSLNKLEARLPARQSNRLKHAVLTAMRYERPAVPAVSPRVLRKATWEEQVVRFSYTDVAGRYSERQVNPLSLVFFDRSTTLISWCHLREDFRVFRLDRMRDLKITGESFRPHRVPLLRAALAKFREDMTASQQQDHVTGG